MNAAFVLVNLLYFLESREFSQEAEDAADDYRSSCEMHWSG